MSIFAIVSADNGTTGVYRGSFNVREGDRVQITTHDDQGKVVFKAILVDKILDYGEDWLN